MKAALMWVGIGSLLRFLIVGRENVKETPDANRTVKLSPLGPMVVLLVREQFLAVSFPGYYVYG